MKLSYWPRVAIRVVAGVFEIVVLSDDRPLSEWREILRRYSVMTERYCCLVLGDARCIYFAPDGSWNASAEPPKGVELRLTKDEWASEVRRYGR